MCKVYFVLCVTSVGVSLSFRLMLDHINVLICESIPPHSHSFWLSTLFRCGFFVHRHLGFLLKLLSSYSYSGMFLRLWGAVITVHRVASVCRATIPLDLTFVLLHHFVYALFGGVISLMECLTSIFLGASVSFGYSIFVFTVLRSTSSFRNFFVFWDRIWIALA